VGVAIVCSVINEHKGYMNTWQKKPRIETCSCFYVIALLLNAFRPLFFASSYESFDALSTDGISVCFLRHAGTGIWM